MDSATLLHQYHLDVNSYNSFAHKQTEDRNGYIPGNEDEILQTLIRGVRHSCVGKDRQIGEIGQTNRQIGNQGKQIVSSSPVLITVIVDEPASSSG